MEAQPPTGDLRSQLLGNTQSDGAVFKTVLFYSVLILLLPIGSFFTTKSIIFEIILGQVSFILLHIIINILHWFTYFDTQESTIGSNIVSAVVSVIVLHLALGLFIYKVRTLSFSTLIVDDQCFPGLLWQRQEGNQVGLRESQSGDINYLSQFGTCLSV